jgi:hypothetical protein
VQTLGDVLDHPLGVLVEHGVVFDDDQGVSGLFKNGHELKDSEGSADLQVRFLFLDLFLDVKDLFALMLTFKTIFNRPKFRYISNGIMSGFMGLKLVKNLVPLGVSFWPR